MATATVVELPVRQATTNPTYVCLAGGVDGPVYEYNGAWYMFGSGRNATNTVQASWKSTDNGANWTATWHTSFVWGNWLNNGDFRPAHYTARVGNIVYIYRRTTTSTQEVRVLAFDLTTESMTSRAIATLTGISFSDRKYNIDNSANSELFLPLSNGNVALLGSTIADPNNRHRLGAWEFNTTTDTWGAGAAITPTYTATTQSGTLYETPAQVFDYDGKFHIKCFVQGSHTGAPERFISVTKDLATTTVLHNMPANGYRMVRYGASDGHGAWGGRDIILAAEGPNSFHVLRQDILTVANNIDLGKWNDADPFKAAWVQSGDRLTAPGTFYHAEDGAWFVTFFDGDTLALARFYPISAADAYYTTEATWTSANGARDQAPWQRIDSANGAIDYITDRCGTVASGGPSLVKVAYFVPTHVTLGLIQPSGSQVRFNGAGNIVLQVSATFEAPATSITSVEVIENSISLGNATYNSGTGYYEMTLSPADSASTTYEIVANADVSGPAEDSFVITHIRLGAPEEITTKTGYTGLVGDLREDPATPANNWVTQNNTGATDGVLHLNFPTPLAALDESANAQAFNLYVRKQGASGDPHPLLDVALYEHGSLVGALATDVEVSHLTGTLLSYPWSASSLLDTSGEGVELRLTATRPPDAFTGGNFQYAPDGVITATGFNASGATALALIDEDPQSPGGDWLTAPLDTAQVLRVSFPTPVGSLEVGAGLQTFRLYVRKNAANNPTMAVSVYENGVSRLSLATGVSVASTTGTLYTYTWNANVLSDITGAGVEIYVTASQGGGGPTSRGTLEVDAVGWEARVASYTLYPSGVDVDAVEWEMATGAGANTAAGSVTSGASTVAGTGTRTIGERTANGAVQSAPSTVAATGTRTAPERTGDGAVTSAGSTVSATGSYVPAPITGAGAVTSGSSVVSGSGVLTLDNVGTGAVTGAASIVAGAGTRTVPERLADGAIESASSTVAGAGTYALPARTGDGQVTASASTIVGAGAFFPPLLIVPDGHISASGIVDQNGGSTDLHLAVDEPFSASDNDTTYLVNSGPTNAHVFLDLANTPSNLGSMHTLNLRVRARRVSP